MDDGSALNRFSAKAGTQLVIQSHWLNNSSNTVRVKDTLHAYTIEEGGMEEADAVMREILTAIGIEGSWSGRLCSGVDDAIAGRCDPVEGHEVAVVGGLP